MTWRRRKTLTETERLVPLADSSSGALSSSSGGEESVCDVDMRESSLWGMGEARGLNFVASAVHVLEMCLPFRTAEKTSSDTEEGNSWGARLRFVPRDVRRMMTRHKRRSRCGHTPLLRAVRVRPIPISPKRSMLKQSADYHVFRFKSLWAIPGDVSPQNYILLTREHRT